MNTARFETTERAKPRSLTSTVEVSPEFRKALLASIPALRGYAFSLAEDSDRADDLVQTTLMEAWAQHAVLGNCAKLNSRLRRMVRDEFNADGSRNDHEAEDVDGAFARSIGICPDQPAHMDVLDLKTALMRLTPEEREALVLVRAEGFSREEAAQICHVPSGMIERRVRRARSHLAGMMGLDGRHDFDPDVNALAALSSTNSRAIFDAEAGLAAAAFKSSCPPSGG